MSLNKPKVAIIDYGAGNIRSLSMAIEAAGGTYELVATSDSQPDDFSHFVLPGVGAFPKAMKRLEERGLVEVIKRFVEAQIPGLGICLGMQLLFDMSSELDGCAGLGLIPGQVQRIDALWEPLDQTPVILPNIGWRPVNFRQGNQLSGLQGRFYFVHSFGVAADNPHVSADISYRGMQVAAEVRRGNLTGCQFHPEKSGNDGVSYLSKFLAN